MANVKQIKYVAKQKSVVDRIIDFVYSPRNDKFNTCPFVGIWEDGHYKCDEVCERLFYKCKKYDECPCYEYTEEHILEVFNKIITQADPKCLKDREGI